MRANLIALASFLLLIPLAVMVAALGRAPCKLSRGNPPPVSCEEENAMDAAERDKLMRELLFLVAHSNRQEMAAAFRDTLRLARLGQVAEARGWKLIGRRGDLPLVTQGETKP